MHHFVRPGETIGSTSYTRFCGGKGLNQSVALARAGAEVWHAGKIGAEGRFLKERLLADGVNVDFVEEVGELARALKGTDPANLREEFADVLAWLTTLASLAGVEMADAAQR